jgi:hypothetical protein
VACLFFETKLLFARLENTNYIFVYHRRQSVWSEGKRNMKIQFCFLPGNFNVGYFAKKTLHGGALIETCQLIYALDKAHHLVMWTCNRNEVKQVEKIL